ncbi:armadillo-type protein [Pisolithus croceorrhizus]|nr:armadillo-type protein [Pisolithus croceorrhizus]
MPSSIYRTDVLVQPAYMLMLSSELANESLQIRIRNAVAFALKNNLSAHIKQEVLVTLASPFLRAGGFFAQVVAAIACVELPHDQWPDLIELLGFVNNLTNANLRIATLKNDWLHLRVHSTYLISVLFSLFVPLYLAPRPPQQPEILSLRSNEILTAVIRGVRHHEPSSGVQLAAAHAPYNSLEFVRENFECEGERNHIMQVVCEATQNPSVSVQVGALECLVKIMALYMEQALLVLTVMGFGPSFVKRESSLLTRQAKYAADYGEPPEIESKFFAKIALPEVNPVLLSLLTLQEEIVDKNEWNMTMSFGTYFNFIAWAVTDPIVDAVVPFIEAYIKSPNRHQWEAAMMALWALPLLIGMTSDSNVHVKDMAAWTLGRIHGLLIATIKPDIHLHPPVPALLEFLEESVPSQTSHLSPYFDGVVNTLLRVTDTASHEAHSRTSAYGAITSNVNPAMNDMIPVIQNTLITILMWMQRLLGMQIVGIDDQNNWNEPQSNLCSVVIVNITFFQFELLSSYSVLPERTRWLGEGIQPMADRIMTPVLQVIQAAGQTSQPPLS